MKIIEKIARFLTRKYKLIALISVLLLIPAAIGLLVTPVNYDILSYIPQSMDSAKGERYLEEPFKMAATTMLIVEDMPADYTNRLVDDIREVDGVSNVVWLSDLMGIQVPTDMIPANFRDMFYSGRGTMMLVQYENPGADGKTMKAIDEIRKRCNKNCYLAGFSTVIKDSKDLVDREMPIYVVMAGLLSLAVLLLTLESYLLPFAFLICIGMAILYNLGTNFFLGQISYVTKAIAAILQLGVTMDYSIFLYRRYVEECALREDKKEAMTEAIKAAFLSLSGSSLTTIAGFLALCSMQLTLGRDIGIVMAKGVALGVATVIFVLPSILLLFDEKIEKFRHRDLLPDFGGLFRFAIRHSKLFVLLFFVLFIPFSAAQSMTKVYYKLDNSLPRDLPAIVANEKLKNDFGMAASHFVIMRDDVIASEMNRMEEEIEAVDGVTSVVSYHSLLGSGIPDFFIPEDLRSMLKTGGLQLIMINSEYVTATDEVSAQIEKLNSIVKSVDPDACMTGEAVLTDDLIKTSAVDFKVANYISIAAIFIIIMVVFKSVSVAALLVAAIELAIFINQGIPYLTDTVIPFISPTVISCIQLGATVDYAILLTTRFKEELHAGRQRKDAILVAARTSAHSIITSALVMLSANIGVCFVSKVEIINSLCTMLARGAIISGCVIFFLLPAVLYVFEPLIAKTSIGWRPAPVKALPEGEAPEGFEQVKALPECSEDSEPEDAATETKALTEGGIPEEPEPVKALPEGTEEPEQVKALPEAAEACGSEAEAEQEAVVTAAAEAEPEPGMSDRNESAVGTERTGLKEEAEEADADDIFEELDISAAQDNGEFSETSETSETRYDADADNIFEELEISAAQDISAAPDTDGISAGIEKQKERVTDEDK